jgi:16S rRNA processing protein RimM
LKTIELGYVTRPHGIRGELKVKLHFEQSDALFEVHHVLLVKGDRAPEAYDVSLVRRAGKGVLLALKGVSTRDAAEQLAGARVCLDREELPALPSDEYYLVDVVGCQVHGPSGPVGVVQSIATHPTVDALVIATPEGRVVEQPLDDHWVERVSIQERLVVLRSLDGLID